MEFAAKSVVVAFDPPNSFSWIPVPPIPIRRIQWWYHLSPEGRGTKVVHEVEVDLGEAREMFGGTEAYNSTRGADVIRGMEKTLQNLKAAIYYCLLGGLKIYHRAPPQSTFLDKQICQWYRRAKCSRGGALW